MRARHFPAAAVLLVASPLRAGTGDDAGTKPQESVWASCTEHLPQGAARPVVREQFPQRGTSGYATALEIVVEHGKGETVLPQGFHVQSGSDASRALAEAGFLLPDPDGGAGPTMTANPETPGKGASTKIVVPFLVLPKEPGRHAMTLPPVPVAIARASGEIVTLCTQPHHIVVDAPTASAPDAKPHPNPEPRVQREEWTLAKQLAIGGLAGAVLAAVAAWLLALWRKRPRPVPPPPPPRPPWEVAFEELFAVRHAGLVAQGRYAEHFDRVSDAVRKYLGGRYGFDGLETTTDEMTSILRKVEPAVPDLPVILGFLAQCDLVKFARLTPSEPDCTRALDEAEHIVNVTLPRMAHRELARAEAGAA
jgi:hypothetical protein